MSRRPSQITGRNRRSEQDSLFDAPRPAATNRLGKKKTDELIRADGDTWQEYLAVTEKAENSSTHSSNRGGVSVSSLFGKKNKKKKQLR
mmetsp:Transcript_34118/g.71286  ORF Transcript_34118/g.71286 Transcript_34118/m.71286 type:complete len:89 (-) Transcript_34118:1590-1856(-)